MKKLNSGMTDAKIQLLYAVPGRGKSCSDPAWCEPTLLSDWSGHVA